MGGAVATFSYTAWVARYPEFNAVTEPMAVAYFTEACLYLRNDGTGFVTNPVSQALFLNMITAHIAALNAQAQGDPNPGASKDPNTPVGRVSAASEGSVSVTLTNDYPPGSVQWFQTTRYGAAYWQASGAYRRFRYRRGRNYDPARAGVWYP